MQHNSSEENQDKDPVPKGPSQTFTSQYDQKQGKLNVPKGVIEILKMSAEYYNGFYVGSPPPSDNPFIKANKKRYT